VITAINFCYLQVIVYSSKLHAPSQTSRFAHAGSERIFIAVYFAGSDVPETLQACSAQAVCEYAHSRQISHLVGQRLYPLHTLNDCAFADRMPPNKHRAKIVSANVRSTFLLLSVWHLAT
jgi:hypothetical protein